MTIHDIAIVRAAILDVIDTEQHRHFYENEVIERDNGTLRIRVTEAMADFNRLNFCDAVQERITELSKG